MLLTEAEITRHLEKTYQPGVLDPSDGFADMYKGVAMRCAAVLVPLVNWNDEWQLVLTRRTDLVEHHKGQVSFPGGGCELGESSPELTALRETHEEIGLKPEEVRLLGRMNDIITITGYRVTPVVGVIPWPYPFKLESAEVERIFKIPLPWLSDRTNWVEQPRSVEGMPVPVQVIHYRPYDGEVLWGISARITQTLLTILGLLN